MPLYLKSWFGAIAGKFLYYNRLVPYSLQPPELVESSYVYSLRGSRVERLVCLKLVLMS